MPAMSAWTDHGPGIVRWGGRGFRDMPPGLEAPADWPAFHTIGRVFYGDDWQQDLYLPAFGIATRFLVPDDTVVGPGTTLVEFEPREPTTQEWLEQFHLNERWYDRWAELDRQLRARGRLGWPLDVGGVTDSANLCRSGVLRAVRSPEGPQSRAMNDPFVLRLAEGAPRAHRCVGQGSSGRLLHW